MNSENHGLGSPIWTEEQDPNEMEYGANTDIAPDVPEELESQPEEADDVSNNRKKNKPSGGLKAEILSWIQILLTAAAIAFVLNTFIIANSKVPSGSMENTIMTFF